MKWKRKYGTALWWTQFSHSTNGINYPWKWRFRGRRFCDVQSENCGWGKEAFGWMQQQQQRIRTVNLFKLFSPNTIGLVRLHRTNSPFWPNMHVAYGQTTDEKKKMFQKTRNDKWKSCWRQKKREGNAARLFVMMLWTVCITERPHAVR